MAATEASRSVRFHRARRLERTLASATRALARVMRCSIAASETRKERSDCFTVARSNAEREPDLLRRRQSGWQQMNNSRKCRPVMRAVEPFGQRLPRRRRCRRSPGRFGNGSCLRLR